MYSLPFGSLNLASLRCLKRSLLLTVLVGAFSLPATAATLTVPVQYATIQAAITASASGDTVLISDGTYTGPGNVDLDFGGKNITVTSVNGAASTIIDCGGHASTDDSGNHRGFYLHSGETNAVISGLTVENGYESSGGGIATNNVVLTVQNCTIKNNTAQYGGGMSNDNSTALFSSSITVIDCSFLSNMAIPGASGPGEGGGILNDNIGNGTMVVSNCSLSGNMAPNGDAGGILNETARGSVIVTDCVLNGNSASNGGSIGGIENYNYGSGLIDVSNCVLIGNSASSEVGGIYNINASAGPPYGMITVTNCTLTGNLGGGIYNEGENGTTALTNDIMYGDTGSEIGGGGATINFCDIGNMTYAGTNGNIDADPLFVSPTDLHLKLGSPCLNKGTFSGAPTTTLDGYTRPNPPSIGAYELDRRTVTTTTLTSSHNPSIIGQSVTFTATVNGSSPTGTVTFTVDGTAQTPVTLSGGVAVSGAFSLAVGPHTITATYTGDTNNAGSTSSPLTQTVQAITIASVSFNPMTLIGGASTTGTLTLTGPAPAGAAVVHLTSSNPAALYVPATAQINPGLTTRTFSAVSHSVAKATTVTVTATYGGATATTTVTVNPAPVYMSAVSFSPSTLAGAATTTGTLTLTAPAPLGNAVVHLTSSNTAVLTVPVTVTLAAGQATQTFTATSHNVSVATTVTVTATYNGTTQTAAVTINPVPVPIASVSFTPASVTGGASTTGTLTLTGPAPVGAAVVHLTSSNPVALYVPATAQINAGLTSRTFSAVSHHVTSTQVVTVTATYGGTSQTTTVTVTP